jgi:hypothetical protein
VLHQPKHFATYIFSTRVTEKQGRMVSKHLQEFDTVNRISLHSFGPHRFGLPSSRQHIFA